MHRALASVRDRAGRHPRGGAPVQRRAAAADARAGQLLPRRGEARRATCCTRPTTPPARSPAASSTGWPPISASPWCTTCATAGVDPDHHRPGEPAGSTCRSRTPASTTPARSLLQALGPRRARPPGPARLRRVPRQRVEVNYFAAALLLPEKGALTLLREAKAAKDIAIEDLRDAYGVSYETAAHRFTNLATRHLDLPVHFMRISSSGSSTRPTRTTACTSRPTPPVRSRGSGSAAPGPPARCSSSRTGRRPTTSTPTPRPAPTGAPPWWTGPRRARSRSRRRALPARQVDARPGDHRTGRRRAAPTPSCCRCRRPTLAKRWDGQAWPSARVHSHLLAAMPPGVFPGVDDTDVLRFLDAQQV